jgi:hypothetical protein
MIGGPVIRAGWDDKQAVRADLTRPLGGVDVVNIDFWSGVSFPEENIRNFGAFALVKSASREPSSLAASVARRAVSGPSGVGRIPLRID